ncbi:hypothetical protein E4U17_005427 [Claviceps sp. LM77 group G4]|nr:hypothetical protein E4U17_005427 [Claviceps sp. LM77 group G4]KAG6066193.1 hypothetical protein E4U33_005640 [Claviceps sp. LM78 group G4]KAG6075345.1 hypothetical protein E4U16_003403 [Claviceps sp. LM84 group G4]
MPRLVRRRPLLERITSMLNPMDFLLWLSEEIETRDWDSGLVGTQLGLGLNFLFLIVRANSGSKPASDDIFGDESSSSWPSILMYTICWVLVAFSVTNAVYTVSRTRKYRLFEADIDVKPNTSSAKRVRVHSNPGNSSPLRFLADMVLPDSADSRAHPEKKRDVWELSMWDPLPVCIQLLCLFSPGHVLVYLIFMPLAPLDPRPSVTVFNTLIMQIVLSVQMILLSSRYSQQAKDSAIIQREVFHEYDTNFVQPRINPVVRDVGTQMSAEQPIPSREFVQTGTPATLVRRSFITHGNPHVDPQEPTPSHRFGASSVSSSHVAFTPSTTGRRSEAFTPAFSSIRSSGLRHSLGDSYSSMQSTPVPRTPAVAPSAASSVANFSSMQSTPVPRTPAAPPSNASIGASTATNSTYKGNIGGAFSHNRSPLKNTVSRADIKDAGFSSVQSSRETVTSEQRGHEAPSSPSMRSEPRRFTSSSVQSSPHPFANMGKHGAAERFPKRWRG